MDRDCNRRCNWTYSWYDHYSAEEKATQEAYIEQSKDSVHFNADSMGVQRVLPSKKKYLLGTKDGASRGER